MTIDGKDIYKEYGCMLLDGAFDGLLKYPKRKTVNYNNWAEVNGIEPDLSRIEFEPRSINMSFLLESDSNEQFWSRYNRLVSDLSAPGYRTLQFVDGLSHQVRLSAGNAFSIPDPFNVSGNLSEFGVTVVEDTPSIPSVSAPSYGGINLRGQISVNGIDFGAFGIGCDDDIDDILKFPGVKEPFTDGVDYYLDTVSVKHKEISLSLWMMAGSVAEFLNYYSSFFTQWNVTGMRELYIKALGGSVNAYYSDCTGFTVEIWQEDCIAVRFSLSLVIPVVTWVNAGGTTIRRVLLDAELNMLLANEEGKVIVFN